MLLYVCYASVVKFLNEEQAKSVMLLYVCYASVVKFLNEEQAKSISE